MESLNNSAWRLRLTRKSPENPFAMAFLWNERTPEGWVKVYDENADMAMEAFLLNLVADRDAVDLLVEAVMSVGLNADQYEVPLSLDLASRLAAANFANFEFSGPY